jgi:small subunit ribosomal protein S13
MFTFKELKLPSKGLTINVLSAIFGIGYMRASYLSSLIGLNLNLNLDQLTSYRFLLISCLLKKFFVLETGLKKSKFRNIQRKIDISNYRGVRFQLKLPIRGQRTKTNAKTAKKR